MSPTTSVHCPDAADAAEVSQGDWYLVQCKARQDQRAEENLARQGYECSRPICHRQRLLRGTVVIVEESLFPGYLFVHMPRGANWAAIRSTRGVSRIVAFGGRPLPVGHELIMQLQARAKSHPVSKFSPGDRVVILDDGFAHIESIFMTTDGEDRVILLINIMNRQQQISFPLASVANS